METTSSLLLTKKTVRQILDAILFPFLSEKPIITMSSKLKFRIVSSSEKVRAEMMKCIQAAFSPAPAIHQQGDTLAVKLKASAKCVVPAFEKGIEIFSHGEKMKELTSLFRTCNFMGEKYHTPVKMLPGTKHVAQFDSPLHTPERKAILDKFTAIQMDHCLQTADDSPTIYVNLGLFKNPFPYVKPGQSRKQTSPVAASPAPQSASAGKPADPVSADPTVAALEKSLQILEELTFMKRSIVLLAEEAWKDLQTSHGKGPVVVVTKEEFIKSFRKTFFKK